MRARGYTLVELMIALTISLIGVAAGMTLLIGTQHWFQSGVDDRGLQETARVALDELTSRLRVAGYGLEPGMVFDMGVLQETVMDRVPPANRNQVRFGGYCGDGVCVRDQIDAPDELVFYARDKRWARDVTAVGVNALTLAPAANPTPEPILRGQVLQVMCYGTGGQWLWAYVTVGAVQVENTGETQLTLAPSPGQPFDFPFQNSLLAQPCFGAPALPPNPTVRAFKVDRYRYHVAAIREDGAVVAWGTAGARPYLMLDQGLRDEDGNPIDRAVAPDVEDLQVAYVFPLAPAGQVLAVTPATQVLPDIGGVDEGVFNLKPARPFVIPSFATAPSDIDLARTSHHPANIRAVRVAVTVRTARKDIQIPDAAVPAAFNREEVDGEAGYRRMVFESTAYTHNLEARVPVFPMYDAQAYLNDCKAPLCTEEPCARGLTGNCGGG